MFALLQYAQLQGEPESRCLAADQLIQKTLGRGRAVRLFTHEVKANSVRSPTESFTFQRRGHGPGACVLAGRRHGERNQLAQRNRPGSADQRNLDALRRE